MSKIPLSRDFRITPSTVSAAGTALDVCGLLLSDNELLPVGKVTEFTSASAVGASFGTAGREYAAASLYFAGYGNSTVRPAAVLFGRMVKAPASGWLLSGSFKGSKIAVLQGITGTITLTVDGASVTSSELNLSTATSFSDAATIIAAAIGSKVTVNWLPTQSRFIVRSATTGSNSAVSQAVDGGAATALKLTNDTAATTSDGSDAVSMTDMMDNIANKNQDWVMMASLVDLDDEDKEELCSFVSSSSNRFGYSYYDTSEDATVSNNSSCFHQSVVVTNGYENVFANYGTYLHAIPALAYSASLNFSRTNGRVSYKHRSFSGLTPSVDDDATASALESNGYNYYGDYGQGKNTEMKYTSEGVITGKFLWIDSFISEVWLNANLVVAFANMFTNNASYAFNAAGYSAISAAVIDVASSALNFGAIRTGVTLDQSQINIVNDSVGQDISNTLYTQGWFFYIPTQTGSSRTERHLDGAIFYYVDGQLIQSISMTSTDIL
ncbi:DUF3383 domain-containing protein [Lonsdalea quercina]|uniref:DUF3383 domain-containing protein n=1 Tax=Lonsdalea quercina TaxID=71657 RepID=UPI003976C709